MINIQVNNNSTRIQSSNLDALLAELGYQDTVVATALNGQFVSQQQRVTTPVNNGDRVEILAPMQGG